MQKVFATRAGVVVVNGVPTTVSEGDPFDMDDPVVAEFRWMFSDPVEQATAAPGEKRATARRKR